MERCALVEVFGRNVRHVRLGKGWSQERLAAEADLDRTYISDIERGARNPTLATVARLAAALGVEPPRLLTPVPNGTTAEP